MIIALKLPNDFRERLKSFHFVYRLQRMLQRQMEDDDSALVNYSLHLLCAKEDIEVLNFLPFHAYSHPINADDLESFITLHRRGAEINIPRVDYFLHLDPQPREMVLGRTLGARKRLGFVDKWSKYFFTSAIVRNEGKPLSEDINRFGPMVDPQFEKVKLGKVVPKEFEPSEEHVEFIFVEIPIEDGELDEVWIEFFNYFSEATFAISFMGAEGPRPYFEKFKKLVNAKNHYSQFLSDSLWDFGKTAASSYAQILFDPKRAMVAAYLGMAAEYIQGRGDFNLEQTDIDHFNGRLNFHEGDDMAAVFDSVIELHEGRNNVIDLDKERPEA